MQHAGLLLLSYVGLATINARLSAAPAQHWQRTCAPHHGGAGRPRLTSIAAGGGRQQHLMTHWECDWKCDGNNARR